MQFKKSFPFRKKKTDSRDDSSDYVENQDAQSTTVERETPPRPSASTTSDDQFQNRSSGTSSNFSHTKTIESQFAPSLGTSSTYRGFEASTKDPLGLKVVHRPSGQRLVDIIFVHGLGGSSRMTWSHDRNPDFFWPLKFLPHEPDINEARILTFGYNADFRPGSNKNKMSVLDFAKDLLFDLKHAQDESVPEIEDLGMGEVRLTALSLAGICSGD